MFFIFDTGASSYRYMPIYTHVILFSKKAQATMQSKINVELHEKLHASKLYIQQEPICKSCFTNKPTECVDKTLSVDFATLKT